MTRTHKIIAAIDVLWIFVAIVCGVVLFCKMIETNSTAEVFLAFVLLIGIFGTGFLAGELYEWRFKKLTRKRRK